MLLIAFHLSVENSVVSDLETDAFSPPLSLPVITQEMMVGLIIVLALLGFVLRFIRDSSFNGGFAVSLSLSFSRMSFLQVQLFIPA